MLGLRGDSMVDYSYVLLVTLSADIGGLFFYFNDTISPVLISLAAAALTLVGVNRLRRPMKSDSPHTQAVGIPGGA